MLRVNKKSFEKDINQIPERVEKMLNVQNMTVVEENSHVSRVKHAEDCVPLSVSDVYDCEDRKSPAPRDRPVTTSTRAGDLIPDRAEKQSQTSRCITFELC